MAALHVFTDEVDSYVAENLEEAMAAQRAHAGLLVEHQDPAAWEQCPDERELAIHTDENGNAAHGDAPLVTKTCAEWAAANGRGFLCSTEY
jgi:hypothetical protein